jgi:quinoprotein glucose dehydrogenase
LRKPASSWSQWLMPVCAGIAGVAGLLFAQTPGGPNGKSSVPGDPARGKFLFEGKGQCLTCHRVNGTGGRFGPDLTEVGSARRNPRADTSIPLAKSLELSILEPDAEVLPENRFIRIVTKDGKTVTGRLLNQDAYTVQFRDPQDKLQSWVKADLREVTVITKSQMPSYKGKLSDDEVSDLVTYLSTLK